MDAKFFEGVPFFAPHLQGKNYAMEDSAINQSTLPIPDIIELGPSLSQPLSISPQNDQTDSLPPKSTHIRVLLRLTNFLGRSIREESLNWNILIINQRLHQCLNRHFILL